MKTMNDLYGDGSNCIACEKCGYCITCGDCYCHSLKCIISKFSSGVCSKGTKSCISKHLENKKEEE